MTYFQNHFQEGPTIQQFLVGTKHRLSDFISLLSSDGPAGFVRKDNQPRAPPPFISSARRTLDPRGNPQLASWISKPFQHVSELKLNNNHIETGSGGVFWFFFLLVVTYPG